MNDKLYQVTAGTGPYEGQLFCIRALRPDGRHSMWRMNQQGEVAQFPLNKEYFLSDALEVTSCLLLAKFCSYIRRRTESAPLHLWMRNQSGRLDLLQKNGWVGVDLDGTLAHYDEWKGIEHIGHPIPKMADRVRGWLFSGEDVRIFTGRVSVRDNDSRDVSSARRVIENWTEEHFGLQLPVTNVKDMGMRALYDDRAFQVEKNTGRIVGVNE